MMKKRKDEEAKMSKAEFGVTTKPIKADFGVTAVEPKTPKLPSAIVSGILKDVVKARKYGEESKLADLDRQRAKDANAVTEIDGEIVKWKAGSNPAYEEKLMKLKKKK